MRLVLSLVFFLLMSCSEESGFKRGRTFIGDQKVSADVLTKGKHIYIEYCMACHGMDGDGNGPAAKGSVPPPRNFKQGLYKFGLVQDGGLPTDEDLVRIIQHGLKGTAMLEWDISKEQSLAVIQYIKTFAPHVWENEDNVPGTPVKLSDDPYTIARREAAIQKGKEVYHMTASCQSCHRAYATYEELSEMNQRYYGEPITDFDPEMYNLKPQVSEYYFYDSEERFMKFLPPDFTWHEIRSAQTVKDLAYRLAAGVTGTGMPAWKGTIEDHEIWAVAYYVKSLMELKDKPEQRKEFMNRFHAQNAAYEMKKTKKKEKVVTK